MNFELKHNKVISITSEFQKSEMKYAWCKLVLSIIVIDRKILTLFNTHRKASVFNLARKGVKIFNKLALELLNKIISLVYAVKDISLPREIKVVDNE